MLSSENDINLALWTALVPTTMMVLGYHLILRPRRRAQRTAYFKAARQTLEEDSSVVRRQLEDTASLLKETARKHMQAESSKGGLVIVEAKYGPTEIDDETKDLLVDVTIPMQALVHHSQVYVPGHRSKSGIQGFYDPAPALPKTLRVRYNFQGRVHYAEVPDFVPVVLPLVDHVVSF